MSRVPGGGGLAAGVDPHAAEVVAEPLAEEGLRAGVERPTSAGSEHPGHQRRGGVRAPARRLLARDTALLLGAAGALPLQRGELRAARAGLGAPLEVAAPILGRIAGRRAATCDATGQP